MKKNIVFWWVGAIKDQFDYQWMINHPWTEKRWTEWATEESYKYHIYYDIKDVEEIESFILNNMSENHFERMKRNFKTAL